MTTTCPTEGCDSTTWAGFDGSVACVPNGHILRNDAYNALVAESESKANGTWQEPTYTAAQWAAMQQSDVNPLSAPEVYKPAPNPADQPGVTPLSAPEVFTHPDMDEGAPIPAPPVDYDAAPPAPVAPDVSTDKG